MDSLEEILAHYEFDEKIFNCVEKQYDQLLNTWTIFEELYLGDEERRNVLEAEAPLFFAHLQPVLSADMANRVWSLVEDGNDHKGENISFARLLWKPFMKQHSSRVDDLGQLRGALAEALKDSSAKDSCMEHLATELSRSLHEEAKLFSCMRERAESGIQKSRFKQIGHFDEETLRDSPDKFQFSPRDVEVVILCMARILYSIRWRTSRGHNNYLRMPTAVPEQLLESLRTAWDSP